MKLYAIVTKWRLAAFTGKRHRNFMWRYFIWRWHFDDLYDLFEAWRSLSERRRCNQVVEVEVVAQYEMAPVEIAMHLWPATPPPLTP